MTRYLKAFHRAGGTLLTALVLGLGTLSGCDDRSDAVGLSVLPDYAKATAESASLSLSYRTVSAGSLGGKLTETVTEDGMTLNSMFVNSGYAYLGSIPNEEFGEVKSEYLTQFYVPEGFKFATPVYEDRIDSVFLTLYYNGFTGDATQPMSVEAYKLTKPLPSGDNYSVGDITEYVEGAEKLGTVSYTARLGSGDGIPGTVAVRIPLPKSLGQDFYDRSRTGDPVFSSQAAFDQFFPGVYLKNGAGKGSVLQISRTALTFYYQTKNAYYDPAKPVEGVSEYITGVQELSHTREVPQASRYGNYDLEKLLTPASAEAGYAYIKAPAGVFTEITIPTTRLAQLLSEESGVVKELNGAPLTVIGEPNDENVYLLKAPTDLILLPRDSVEGFFEKEYTELNARMTSYVSATTISGSSSYTFGNIAPLLSEHIEKHPDTDLKVLLIPVERTLQGSSSGTGSQTGYSTSVSNQILPAAVKFKADGDINKSLQVYITRRPSGAAF